MEFRDEEDFRNIVTGCAESYVLARPDLKFFLMGPMFDVRGVLPFASPVEWMAYFLGIAYYAIGLYHIYRDKKRAKGQREKALTILKRLAKGGTDFESDLDVAHERLSELARKSGALGLYELLLAIYPIWRRIHPEPDEAEESFLVYVLRYALQGESKPNAGKTDDPA